MENFGRFYDGLRFGCQSGKLLQFRVLHSTILGYIILESETHDWFFGFAHMASVRWIARVQFRNNMHLPAKLLGDLFNKLIRNLR